MSTKSQIDLIEEALAAAAPAGCGASPEGERSGLPAARRCRVELPEEVRDRLSDEVIDELLAGARTEEEIVGPGGVLAQVDRSGWWSGRCRRS